MSALRTVLAYVGFVLLTTGLLTSFGCLLGEFFRPSAYTNYIPFWSFFTGLFGSGTALVAKHVFRR